MTSGLKILPSQSGRLAAELSLEPTDDLKERKAGESADKILDQLSAEGQKEYKESAKKLNIQHWFEWNPDPVAYLIVAVSFVLIFASLLVYYIDNTRNLNLHRDELVRGVTRLDELVASIDNNAPISDNVIIEDITSAPDAEVLKQRTAKMLSPSADAETVTVQEVRQSPSAPQTSGLADEIDELRVLVDKQTSQIDFLATENHELRLLLEFSSSSKNSSYALSVNEVQTSAVVDESVADQMLVKKQPVVEILAEDKISVELDTNSDVAVLSVLNDDQTQAISIYRQLLSEDPHDLQVFAKVLQLADAENNLEQELLTHIEKYPEVSAAMYAAFGNYHSMKQQWSLAWRFYLKSVVKEPTADVLYNLAVSLEHLGRQSEAAQRYQQALAIEGNHSFDRQSVKNRLLALSQR